MGQNIKQAIIPAAGPPKNILFPNTYDPMVPINGVPTIRYILDTLLESGVKEVFLILNENDKETPKFIAFLSKSLTDLKIKIIKTAEKRGPGYSVYLASQFISEKPVFINLGDTIYPGKNIPEEDFILVSNRYYTEPKNWCFVDRDEKGLKFYNKPDDYLGGKTVCGVYYLRNSSLLKEICNGAEKTKKKIELHDLLLEYSYSVPIKLLDEDRNWFDLGHVEGYFKSKVNFLRIRNFNSLDYNRFEGTIVKKSKDEEKLFLELNWFLNLPNSLRIFTPRVIDFNLKEGYQYSLEFYNYPSLADLFLYGNLNLERWKSIVTRLVEFYDFVKDNFSVNLAFKSYHAMYVGKTLERISKMGVDNFFDKLWHNQVIEINGRTYHNLSYYLNQKVLEEYAIKLYNNNSDSSIVHGDFCFSNILYDISSGIFKLIDPRGKFGEKGIYGDVKYDLAKLRHSIGGKYEYIISDLFTLEKISENKFNYNFYDCDEKLLEFYDELLKRRGYDLSQIKFVEALLFLTMIPLHTESRNRQIMMYLRSVELFHQIFNKNYETGN